MNVLLAALLATPPLVIQGGKIFTVSGATLERGRVVVEGGKITAVGESVPIPPGAVILDATGQRVYPGLIDGLTTLGLREIDAVRASVDVAETGDVNPQAQAFVALHPESELIPVARANGVALALASPEGGLVSGQAALIRLAGDTPEALRVKAPAAMAFVYPEGLPPREFPRPEDSENKTFEEWQKEKTRNQERDLRRLANLLEDSKAYRKGVAAAAGKEVPRRDLVLEALALAATGEIPALVRADTESDIRGAVQFAEQRGLRLVIAGGLEAWRCADLLKAKGASVLLKVDRLPRRERDPYDVAYKNPSVLYAAGVAFAIVTDDASNSRNLPYEAAMARAYGLSEAVALRSITLSPAEILGVSDRVGSIAPGKEADLVIARGDIMDPRTEVTHVIISGVDEPLETRHTRLYKAFKDRP